MTIATLVMRLMPLSGSTLEREIFDSHEGIRRNEARRSMSAFALGSGETPADTTRTSYTSSGRTLGAPRSSVASESAMAEWSPTISVLSFAGSR